MKHGLADVSLLASDCWKPALRPPANSASTGKQLQTGSSVPAEENSRVPTEDSRGKAMQIERKRERYCSSYHDHYMKCEKAASPRDGPAGFLLMSFELGLSNLENRHDHY